VQGVQQDGGGDLAGRGAGLLAGVAEDALFVERGRRPDGVERRAGRREQRSGVGGWLVFCVLF